MLDIAIVIALEIVVSAGAATSVPVPYISSDAWFRSGPSTSHERIAGLPRGTAVLEVAGPDLLFEPRSGRWVQVRVLEGRAAGREGWVWGAFVSCCKDHQWVDHPPPAQPDSAQY